MRRMYIGVGLLVGILVVGSWISGAFIARQERLSREMAQVQLLALRGDWAGAGEGLRRAEEDWAAFRRFAAAVADHAPLEETDALFLRLKALAALRQYDEFASECAQLTSLTEAQADAQRLTWWNIL